MENNLLENVNCEDYPKVEGIKEFIIYKDRVYHKSQNIWSLEKEIDFCYDVRAAKVMHFYESETNWSP